MAQPYAAYPPPGGYYGSGYDYSAYYPPQQHHHHYDPNQAYWAQQYPPQQGQYAAAPPHQQAPPPAPPQAPPLPADEPPPLPPDDAEAATAAAAAAGRAAPPPPAPPAEGAKAQDAAASAPGQAHQQQQQAQAQVAPDGSNASGSHYSHTAQYPHYAHPHYGGGYYGQPAAYGAPPPGSSYAAAGYGAPPYGYNYGSHDPSANSSYAPQVSQQANNNNTAYPPKQAPPPSGGTGHSPAAPPAGDPPAGSSRPSRWNRAPPPASLTAGGAGSGGGRPTAIRPATLVGGGTAGTAAGAAGASSAAGGSTMGGLDPAKLSAAISAATAAAAAVQTGMAAGSSAHHQQQQQFISVATVQQPAAQQQQGGARQDLPASFNQYVQRALLRAGGDGVRQAKLKALLLSVITEHRQAGTMWSTDWDRKPLPELDSPSAAGATTTVVRGSVFERMTSPHQQGRRRDGSDDGDNDGDDYYRGRGGYSSRGYTDSYSRDSSRYYGGSPTKGSNKHQQRGSNKRSWDDSRYSGSDSDDERSDSWDNDGSYKGSRAADAVDRWEPFTTTNNKKKQRLELQQQGVGGRGGGRGAKGKKHQQQQQEGGRGRGRGRGNKGGQQHLSAADLARQAARSARFGAALQMAAYGWEDDGSEAMGGFIVGTCQKLEKRYLRLTRAPLPEEVRPQPVLEAALQRLLGMIAAKADKYLYYNDQFKAMRQDLTVQGIKNEFTVRVYEAHGRAALEYGDNAEYNQCQAQLAILYARGLPGSHAEFGAYRLLYQSVYANHGEGRKLLGTLRQLVGNRVGEVAASPEVQHAMQVRQALACGNVMRFFRLYPTAPWLSRRLMDAGVKQLRYKLLCAMVRSHRPTAIGLPFLTRSLGFVEPEEQQQQQQLGGVTVDSSGRLLPGCSVERCVGDTEPCVDEQQGMAACLEWCKRHGAVFDQERDLSNSVLLSKDCWNKLFVPVDTSKVAHGDANLDIRDFLAVN